LHLFPFYLSLFGQGFEAYAAFGVFLILMLWLYLLGLVLVMGVELNAFLERPTPMNHHAPSSVAPGGHAPVDKGGRGAGAGHPATSSRDGRYA
jgi:uncharacterized BrkB/YihY/UPF0761 family membrane protein